MRRLWPVLALLLTTQTAWAQYTGTSTGGPAGSTPPASTSAPAAGASFDPAKAKPPVFKKDVWQWGVAAFSSKGLDGDLAPLANNLPLQLLQGWPGITTHTLTAAETAWYRDSTLKKAVTDSKKALSDLLSARDALLFKRNASLTERGDLEKRISDARLNLAWLETLTADQIEVPATAAAKVLEVPDQGGLLEPLTGDPAEYMKAKNLDLLVSGEVSVYRKTYLRITVKVWGAGGSLVTEWKDDLESGEAVARISAARQDLTSAVLGRAWAELSIEAEPTDAEIYWGEKFLGVGAVSLPWAEPGSYNIKIIRPNYVPFQETVKLENRQTKVVRQTLALRQKAGFVVATEPPGADVYLASAWVGKSPVEVALPIHTSLLEVRRPGFEIITQQINPDHEGDLVLPLKPLIPRLKFQQAKDRFYTTMAVFTFSLMGTVLLQSSQPALNRMFLDYSAQVSSQLGSATAAEQAELQSRYNSALTLQQIAQNGTTIGWGVTGLAAAWMMWDLIGPWGYLATAESELF